MSMTRPRPRIVSTTEPGGGKKAARLPHHVSAEGRQRLSELAKKRHAEGGFVATGSGKKSKPHKASDKKRIMQQVAEAAVEKRNAQAIIDVFKDGVHPNQPMHIRLKAASEWLKVEGEEAKLALKAADADSQQHDREELLAILSEKLTSGHAASILRNHQIASGNIIEGSVSEDAA